ncbi:MAG: hypothetical protein EPN75_11250 [Beijerinckiaceae bacterium]|nr:MAG: hypothetical protein EPN75_11250 [Beijerinckiaceae bacterium]
MDLAQHGLKALRLIFHTHPAQLSDPLYKRVRKIFLTRIGSLQLFEVSIHNGLPLLPGTRPVTSSGFGAHQRDGPQRPFFEYKSRIRRQDGRDPTFCRIRQLKS